MKNEPFRILYREFLFRIVDLEVLSAHAEGDSTRLLAQFASLLVFVSLMLAGAGIFWAANVRGGRMPPLVQLIAGWTLEHFLIATTMLVVGIFAVLSWESTFPDARDIFVLGPLPIAARTMFLAKVAAVASALGLTLVSLHVFAGVAWPFALAQLDSQSAPALAYDSPLPPVKAADFPAVMNRDIAPMLPRLDLMADDGRAGIVVGISEHGARRVMAYGVARPDSMFEIGSITKTFTGLLLAQMAQEGKLDLRDRVRDLMPPGVAEAPATFEITLLDLATHHSGLPRMPDNAGPGNVRESYTNYRDADLYDFIKRRGVTKPVNAPYLYSNVGFAILGAALENRAGLPYADLVERRITGPLGMKDTVISLSPEQRARFLEGHDAQRHAAAPWDLSQAIAAAGGLRSTAGDMLTFLDAQLHPEHTPFSSAVIQSQAPRASVSGDVRIALAWQYDRATSFFQHSGATGGFSSYTCFDPRRDVAAVILVNGAPIAFPFVEVLGEHVRQRLAGEPALSLDPVAVPAAGLVRSFLAYWIAMTAAGVFTFCCVLTLEGFAAQILPRRWFLRVSALLQLAAFCLFVTAYFFQRSPVTVLWNGSQRPWLSWIPSYWFLGLYQQLGGSLHPALAPFAQRAWLGLAAALAATAFVYAASYFRTLRRIVEQPDVTPGFADNWLPRFGGEVETAIAQFGIRSFFRSRQHRMIFSFYLGVGLGFAILFLNAPRELLGGGPLAADPWHEPAVPLLAATIAMMGFWVVGARTVFSLPLDLRANWIFRVTPLQPGPEYVRARRRGLFFVSVIPAWTISAALLLALWPWRPAAWHLAGLACFGVLLAEFSLSDVIRIPFACSYLPGRSQIHLKVLFWIYMILAGIVSLAAAELRAFERPAEFAAALGVLAAAAFAAVVHNNWIARPGHAELRFEEEYDDRIPRMDLS